MNHGIIITITVTLLLTSSLASAGSITDIYTTGDPLTTTTLDNIKTAVNDNDTTKQDRVTGTCPANQSIQVINANGTVTCEVDSDTNTTYTAGTGLTLSGTTFSLSSPASGSVYATPTLCQRGTNGGAPYDQTNVISPPVNSWGPSIGTTLTTVGSTTWLCPVNIQTPVAWGSGSTLTLTGATLAAVDWSNTTCLVKAELRYKTFGSSSNGTILSTVYSGSNSTDYAFSSTSPITKPFPAFSYVLNNTDILFVVATIQNNGAVSNTNCRYSGVMVDYSIDAP